MKQTENKECNNHPDNKEKIQSLNIMDKLTKGDLKNKFMRKI